MATPLERFEHLRPEARLDPHAIGEALVRREEAGKAEATARTTFEEGALAENLPSIETAKAELDKGIGILTASVQAGFVSSTSEARRQIKSGGIKVNDVTVTDEKMLLTPKDLTQEGVIKLSMGKKRHVLLRAV